MLEDIATLSALFIPISRGQTWWLGHWASQFDHHTATEVKSL